MADAAVSKVKLYYCERCEDKTRFDLNVHNQCPVCGESEDIFLLRLFRCSGCGHEDRQEAFYGTDYSAEQNPQELQEPRLKKLGLEEAEELDNAGRCPKCYSVRLELVQQQTA